MKVFLAALVFFLIAFAGLATGLLLKRKGLRGGCSPATGSGRDCQCKSAPEPTAGSSAACRTQADKDQHLT